MDVARTYGIPIPALLRASWVAYSARVCDALALCDFDDIPRNGLYVIGALAVADASLADIAETLRVSKQATGQLIGTLVLRGYLECAVDDADRRRLTIALTERGRAAAVVQRRTADALDAHLLDCLGSEAVEHLRSALLVLAQLGRDERQD